MTKRMCFPCKKSVKDTWREVTKQIQRVQPSRMRNQSTNQPINWSTNQPIKQSTNQPIKQSTNQPINRSTNQPIKQIKPTPPPIRALGHIACFCQRICKCNMKTLNAIQIQCFSQIYHFTKRSFPAKNSKGKKNNTTQECFFVWNGRWRHLNHNKKRYDLVQWKNQFPHPIRVSRPVNTEATKN